MARLHLQRRLRPRTVLYTLALSATYIFVHLFISRENAFYNPTIPHFNYFMEAEEYSKLGYIVNTPNCHILNISAWDKSIVGFLANNSQLDCRHNREWTYVDRYRNLVINSTAVRESGFSLESVSCCFKTIQRVNQSLDNYDGNADSQIKFSSDCHPMSKVTKLLPGSEFIRVFCSSKYWPWSLDVIYRNFHATPLSHRIHHKVKYWARKRQRAKRKKDKDKGGTGPDPDEVPNILILGIDSMSRLSFQRNMPKTREYLRSLGAKEMLGYTKLGENTFPNAIAFMTGLLTSELSSSCNYSAERPIDPCPFIWKEFEEAGYLTSFIEDVPYLATYNYMKTGFVHQPVDFYFRPFMLGVQYRVPRKSYFYLECIGGKTVDEKVQGYIEDILHLSVNTGVPAFLYTWLTNLAHADLNSASGGDDSYASFLSRLDLNNTFLFFISDHGYRYGAIRQTFAGWYEDKLPNFWAFVPPKVNRRFPNWGKRLQENSRRLTSPLDFHKTLLHILRSYSPAKSKSSLTGAGASTRQSQNSNSQLHYTPKSKTFSKVDRSLIQSHSFLEEMPLKRNCAESGIPNNFCACVVPKRLELNDTHLLKAASAALRSLNGELPPQCAPLQVSSILAGGVQDQASTSTTTLMSASASESMSTSTSTYIVGFLTTPGSFLFEATVQLQRDSRAKASSSSEKYTLVGQILRMNKINTDVSCVHDDSLEKFCFCANLAIK